MDSRIQSTYYCMGRIFFFPLIFELRLSEFKDLEVKIIGGCSISHHDEDCYELIGFSYTKHSLILWLALKVR